MRLSTYNRLVDRFDSYDEITDRGVAELMAKFQRSDAGSGLMVQLRGIQTADCQIAILRATGADYTELARKECLL
jgi:hypothetical protein